MKIKTLGAVAMFAAMSLSFGIGVHTLSAKAESTNESGATIYTSSEKDYWMITDGSGDYTVSLDNAARMQSAYKGVETVVTPVEGVGDIGITLKGMVNPMANLIVKHDNQVSGQADANAIVYTFTSLSDPDRQISIIATNRYNRSWYTFAFTDELEVKDGFTYIEGTEQKTIGYKDLSAYNDIGYCYWFAGEKEWGAIYQGALTFHLGTDGSVYYNNNSVIGSVADEAFLTASKTQLSGTKYEERYTSEWIAETLTQLAKGARMELKWYDVQTEQLDFHIRGISGSWIGDNGGNGLEYNLGLKHSTIIYKKTNTLYVGETYKLSDLVYGGGFSFRNAQNTSAPLSLSGWYANSANKTAGNNGDSTWYNGLTQMNKTITLTETGTYNMTLAGSFLGYFHSTDFPTNFTFDVVEKTKISYQLNGTEIAADSAKRWSEITLKDLTAQELAQIPNGCEFIGWKINGQTYAVGDVYTVNGDGTDIVFTVALNDTQKPVVTVGEYTDVYYDGDMLTLLSATVSDNSGEAVTADVDVYKDGDAVAVQDGKVALTAGTYTIVYTATDSSGNTEKVERTVVVKEKISVVYKLGEKIVHNDFYRPTEITLFALSAEEISEGYSFIGWYDGKSVVTGTTYTLGTENVTFEAKLQAIEYKATLIYLDSQKENETVCFTIENRTEKLQEIKEKLPEPNNGYGNSWKNLPTELPLQNVTYEETEGAIEYRITFVGVKGVDGVEPITFTVETKDSIVLPSVPACEGYTAVWDKTLNDITLNNITFTAIYTEIEYRITFDGVKGVDGVEPITFTVETKDSIVLPSVPACEGYTAVWDKTLNDITLNNITFTAIYTEIEYRITFDGVKGVDGVEPITFTVETKDSIVLPSVSEREGYTAAWDKTLSDIVLDDITITAKYTAIEYTATVVINGQETTITYTIENRETKLAEIQAMKPVADNEYYSYKWETELPEILPLENGKIYKVIKTEVKKPDSSSDSPSNSSSSSADTSSSVGNSSGGGSTGCFGGINGGGMAMLAFALCGVVVLLIKKKESNK